jgi:transcriptional regulator with GAF, ATPase, and Fis domain
MQQWNTADTNLYASQEVDPPDNPFDQTRYLLLSDYFHRKYSSQFRDMRFQTLSKKTLDKLAFYHWPGNVRELQNVIHRVKAAKLINESHFTRIWR